MHKPKTWALVADGVRARILRGRETGGPPPEPPSELISLSRLTHLQDLLAERPGRTHAAGCCGRRPAMEHGTDPIRQDMRDFAREILDRLDSHRCAGDFERLAIFATPAMLELLREEMPRALRGTVILERSRNLVPIAETELRALVRSEIAKLPDV